MAFGDVEGDEVVELILHFRAGGNREAHSAEQFCQLVDYFHQQMSIPDLQHSPRLCYVSCLPRLRCAGGQRLARRVKCRGDRLLYAVDALPYLAFLVGGGPSQGASWRPSKAPWSRGI